MEKYVLRFEITVHDVIAIEHLECLEDLT
jgi:hypothetical protein